MTRLVSALLVRNEASPDRYLERILRRCAEFSEDILVLDDGSTDDTVELCKRAGALVKQRPASPPMWGAEASARAELWERGAKLAKDGWLLVADADMLLVGDPKPLCASWDVNSWAFVLYDVWSEDEKLFRCDPPWMGHLVPRPWLVRPAAVPAGWRPEWPSRGLHVGHIPSNFPLICGAVEPHVLHWRHLAYAKREHRERKHRQYLEQASQLTEFERKHAESIVEN